MAHVTIDGRDFNLDKLSGKARQQAININPVDQDIRGLLRSTTLRVMPTRRHCQALLYS